MTNGTLIVDKKSYLIINLSNIKEKSGKILIALHKNSSDFPDNKNRKALQYVRPANNNTLTFLLGNIPVGIYAISLLHDANDNKKMDFNFIGVPKEGFGFSKVNKVVLKRPTFKECSFEVKGDTTKININLLYL